MLIAALTRWADTYLLPWVVTTASLLALSRLLALTVGTNRKWTWTERAWTRLTWTGFVLVLLAAAAWTTTGVIAGSKHLAYALFALPGLLTLGGVPMFGIGLGHRLRMQVDVVNPDGKRSSTAASYVATRVEVMGTNKPRGLYAPQGADVINLPEDALSTVPEGKFAASTIKLFRALTSLTPWHASIAIVNNEMATVEIRRNGRQYDSSLISLNALGLKPQAQPSGGPSKKSASEALVNSRNPGLCDVLTAASAFLLIRLSEVHTALTEGLCGATHWRSLACQILAGTPPWQDSKFSEELFAQAVEKDPNNLAAWLGYLYKRSGEALGDLVKARWFATELDKLWARIEKQAKPDGQVHPNPGYEPLELRTAYSRTAMWLNYRLLCKSDGSEGSKERKAVEKAIIAAADFMRTTAKVMDPEFERPRVRSFAVAAVPLAGILYTHVTQLVSSIGQCQWLPYDDKDLRPLALDWQSNVDYATLTSYYTKACIESEVTTKEADHYAILEHLLLAVGLNKLKGAAAGDPSFEPLRGDSKFISLLGGDKSLARLGVLGDIAEGLRKSGIRQPKDLTARSPLADNELAQSLNLPVSTIRWVREICELARSCPRDETAIAWTDLLLLEGIASREELFRRVDKDKGADLGHRLGIRAVQANEVPPSADELYAWACTALSLPFEEGVGV